MKAAAFGGAGRFTDIEAAHLGSGDVACLRWSHWFAGAGTRPSVVRETAGLGPSFDFESAGAERLLRPAVADRIALRERELLCLIGRQMSPDVARVLEPEDVFQESVLVALRTQEPLQLGDDNEVRRWFLAISRNVVRNAARQARRRVGTERHASSGESGESARSILTDPDGASGAEWRDVVAKCLWALPMDACMAIITRDVLGASWSIVAKLLDRPSEEAGRKFHARSREKLESVLRAARAVSVRE